MAGDLLRGGRLLVAPCCAATYSESELQQNTSSFSTIQSVPLYEHAFVSAGKWSVVTLLEEGGIKKVVPNWKYGVLVVYVGPLRTC